MEKGWAKRYRASFEISRLRVDRIDCDLSLGGGRGRGNTGPAELELMADLQEDPRHQVLICLAECCFLPGQKPEGQGRG